MDEPPVQYVKTSDGYSIAFLMSGEGVPLVFLPGQFGDLRSFSQDLGDGPWRRNLASRYCLVQYDGRGQGMSDRGIREEQTIESLRLDLDAVIDAVKLPRYVLLARWYACHIAIHHALANPDRVAALILIGCAEDNGAWPSSLYQLLPEQNWELFLRSQFPRNETTDEERQRMARVNASIQPADLALRARAYAGSDVTDTLPRLRLPTLVLHPRDFLLLPASESMKVASRIPEARFAFIEGDTVPGELTSGMAAIEKFLSDVPELAQLRSRTGLDDVAARRVSRRELEVLRLVAQGKPNSDIASALFITRNTVQNHIKSIYRKLGVSNRTEAAVYAKEHGLI